MPRCWMLVNLLSLSLSRIIRPIGDGSVIRIVAKDIFILTCWFIDNEKRQKEFFLFFPKFNAGDFVPNELFNE